MHWIFIALFIVAFWHILKLEKEIKKMKRTTDVQTEYINLIRDQNITLTNYFRDLLKIVKNMKEQK